MVCSIGLLQKAFPVAPSKGEPQYRPCSSTSATTHPSPSFTHLTVTGTSRAVRFELSALKNTSPISNSNRNVPHTNCAGLHLPHRELQSQPARTELLPLLGRHDSHTQSTKNAQATPAHITEVEKSEAGLEKRGTWLRKQKLMVILFQ